MDTIQKRKNFIVNIVYFALLVGLFYLFFKYAFGICFPILLAMFVATILQRPVNYLTKKTHIARGIISSVLVIFGFVVIGTILVLLVMRLFTEIRGFFDYIMLKLENAPLFIEQITDWFENNFNFLPQGVHASLTETVNNFLQNLLGTAPELEQSVTGAAVETSSQSTDWSWLASPLGAVWGTAKQLPMYAVGLIVAIVTGCFITTDYKTLRDMIFTQAGEANSLKIMRTKRILFSTIAKMGKAYLVLIAVTFTEMMIGLSFLTLIGAYSSGYIFVISLITAIVDILPVLGTGTVLVPWGIWSLCTGNIGFGIGILVVYAIITVVRQIIEPKLVASQLGLPAFVTISAMYIGTQLFGFIGLFLLPISIMLIKVLNDEGVINIFKREKVNEEEIAEEIELEESADKPEVETKTDKKPKNSLFKKRK